MIELIENPSNQCSISISDWH